MQSARKTLNPKRVLAILQRNFGSLNIQKPLPPLYKVSLAHQSEILHTNPLKPHEINLKTLENFTCSMQKWYFQRPFSSKPYAIENEESELICQVINQKEWSDETESELGSLNLELSADTGLSVVKNLENSPDKALSFFKWAAALTDFSHNPSTYNAIVRVLGQNSCIDQFWEMVAEMTNEGYKMDMKTYRRVFRTFLNSGLMEDAVGLFVLMMGNAESNSEHCSKDCSLILSYLAASGSPDIDLVYRVVEALQSGGCTLDKVVYDGIHRCLTIAGRFDEAIGLMKTMEEEGFVPDNATYSQLVFGLCKAGSLDEACKVLDAMKELGCTPDVRTWRTLIDGHCKAGEVDKGISLFELMLESGCNANAKVLGILVNAVCGQKRVKDAHGFLFRMIEEKGFKASRETFMLLLKKLTRAKKLQEAVKLSDLMMNQGFPARVDPFYKLFTRKGKVDEAVDFLKKVTTNRPKRSAIKIYFKMLNAYRSVGKRAEACELLYKSPRHIHRNPDLLFQFDSIDDPVPTQNA